MDVNSYLTSLAKSLILSSQEKEKIETSFQFIKEKLWGHFQDKLYKVELFGSLDRGTMLPKLVSPQSDADMLVIFKAGDLQPQTYLNQLKEFAEKNYQKSEIYQDHPTITLELNHIRIELVPAYFQINTWSADELKIPAPKSKDVKWITTNPAEFKNSLIDKDKRENNMIFPLVRLIKYWNATQGYPFFSYTLESFTVERRYPCTTLKEYFFELISDLAGKDWSKEENAKVAELKKSKENLIVLEKSKMTDYTEQELKKLLPSID